MSLVDQYPDPGPAPPAPASGGMPSPELYAYNRWVEKTRQYAVAMAVDSIITLEAGGVALTAEQRIAAILGRAFLEDRLSSHSPFAGMFG